MDRGRSTHRLLAAWILAMATMPLFGGHAQAAVVTWAFTDGVFTITGTAGDDNGLFVTCSVNEILLSGTTATAVACDQVTTLRVNALAGNDLIDTHTAAAFLPAGATVIASGGPGNDEFRTSELSDTFKGGGGYDSVVGYLKSMQPDKFSGGKGYDSVRVTDDFDITLTDTQLTWLGTASLSTIEQADLIGGAGANTLDASGWTRSCYLGGEAGKDKLVGGPGPDQIEGGDGDDELIGGGGNDLLRPDDSLAGNDSANGGKGRDMLAFTSMSGGTLSDTQAIGQGTDPISSIEHAWVSPGVGGMFTFSAASFSGDTDMVGTVGPDILTGGKGDDSFNPQEGNDNIVGNEGSNTLRLTANGDATIGASQADSSDGTDDITDIGRVEIFGAAAAQTITATGFPGTLTFQTLGGSDTIHAAQGRTTVSANYSGDIVATDSSISTVAFTVTLDGVDALGLGAGNGDDTVDTHAFSGPVHIFAGGGSDTVTGGPKGDVLVAGDGNDVVLAGKGNDVLYGQAGKDLLNGGTGIDGCDAKASEKDKAISCEKKAPKLQFV